MNLLLINGPNLNLLGKRTEKHYGKDDLASIVRMVKEYAAKNGDTVEDYQSNHEGDIIDMLHKKGFSVDGIIINPGAFTHYSFAIRDAIEVIPSPVIEVHISNIHARDDFRRKSVTAEVCLGQIAGFGKVGYLIAMDAMRQMKQKSN